MGGYNKFVIITPGRSGSTFLARTLNEHPEVSCEEEIFNRSVHDPGSFNAFLADNLYYRFLGFWFNREMTSTWKVNIPLQWLIKKFLQTKPASPKGFKVSLDQLFAYPQLFKILSSYRVIYLTREDKTRMVLSLLAARRTGNYYAFDGTKVTLEPSQVKSQLHQLLDWEKKCLELLRPGLVLKTKELFENQELTFERMQDYLQLTAPLTPIESSRTHPSTITEWVENYEEIVEYLDQ